MNEEETVSAATWRVAEAASHVREVAERHRANVLGVEQAERTLLPTIDPFLEAVTALRTFTNVRKWREAQHERENEELHRRTLFWLTYVRFDSPGYEMGEVTGRHGSAKVVIDRARGVIEFVQSLTGRGESSHYADALLAQLTPLFERSVQGRAEMVQADVERQRLKGQVRSLMVPVHRGLVPLRILLRNALGSAHVDVRLLNVDPPRSKKKDEKAKKKVETKDKEKAA